MRKLSPETKQKMREAHLGKTLSELHKEAISRGKLNKPRKPFSDQHRYNMHLAQQKRRLKDKISNSHSQEAK